MTSTSASRICTYTWPRSAPRPAQELAEANHVPVATVHRWIREAKVRRLLLLPAHRGAYGSRASDLEQT